MTGERGRWALRTAAAACVAILAAASFSGCRTNQQNMLNAYQIAVDARDSAKEDSTIYMQYRQQMKHGTISIDGEDVDVSIQFVRVTEGGGGIPESLKRYCVVAGEFKMEFNAKSMRQRLVDNGYPGAFVVQTREPYYFVVAAAYDTAQAAKETLQALAAGSAIQLKAPCPFILEPSQLRK